MLALSVIFYWVYDVINLIAGSAYQLNRDASKTGGHSHLPGLSSREFSTATDSEPDIHPRTRKLSALWAVVHSFFSRFFLPVLLDFSLAPRSYLDKRKADKNVSMFRKIFQGGFTPQTQITAVKKKIHVYNIFECSSSPQCFIKIGVRPFANFSCRYLQ